MFKEKHRFEDKYWDWVMAGNDEKEEVQEAEEVDQDVGRTRV